MKLNFSAVLRILGFGLLCFGTLLVIPLLTAFIYDEYYCIRGLVLCMTLCFTLGTIFIKSIKPSKQPLLVREGFLIVALFYTGIALLGTIPFLLSGEDSAFVAGTAFSFSTAFFEAVAGITSTAANAFSDISVLPASIVLFRSLLQWFGSLCTLAFAMVLLQNLGISGSNIDTSEALIPRIEKFTPKLKGKLTFLTVFYAALTAAEAGLLSAGGIGFFNSVNLALATVSTGGFVPASNLTDILSGSYSKCVIMLFMLLTSMNYIIYYQIYRDRTVRHFKDREIPAFFTIAAFSALLLFVSVRISGTADFSALDAAFQTVSLISSTGFCLYPFSTFPTTAKIIALLLICIGGCTVSAAGGIKVARSVICIKYLGKGMEERLHPSEISYIRWNGKNMTADTVSALVSFLSLYAVCAVLCTVLTAAGGMDFEAAFSASLSCLSNNGAMFADGAANAYHAFPLFSKYVLIFAMLAGKLEIYPLLMVFTRMFRNMDKPL